VRVLVAGSQGRQASIGESHRVSGLVSAWGETDAYTNRYHGQARLSKLAAGAQTDQRPELGDGAADTPKAPNFNFLRR
jgi:hypothetical protein